MRAGGSPVEADVPDQAELGAVGRGGRLVFLREGALKLLGEVAQVGMAVALEGHGYLVRVRVRVRVSVRVRVRVRVRARVRVSDLVLVARGEAGRVIPAGDHVVDVALVHVHIEAHARRVVILVIVGYEGLVVDPIARAHLGRGRGRARGRSGVGFC